MTGTFTYGPMTEAELLPHAALLNHAFADNPTAVQEITWQKQLGLECFRAVRAGDGQLAAGMGMIPMGQWFGGRSVATSGIAAVVVAPEYRGAGVASLMMRAAMEEMRAAGIPLSTLFASTQTIYRKMGYEQAGLSLEYRVPIAALPGRASHLTVRAATPADEPELRRLYTERVRTSNGPLDRHAIMWEWILREHPPVSAYVAEREGVAEGYVVYRQRRNPGDPGKVVKARDLVATTPDAARQLLSFLAGHRRVADSFAWNGPPADPLLLLMTEQEYTLTEYQQWMVRVLHVPAALEARGYPPGVGGEVHLAIRDDQIPANDGPIVLTVADGRATVRPGGAGRIELDVRGLAAIYTAYLTPSDLRLGGYLRGPEEDLATLATLFAGPLPWMADHF